MVSEYSLVHEVTAASVHVLRSMPPMIEVNATGQCGTSGWTDGTLVARRYIAPPEDGIQDFDFVARPPSGIMLPMTSPITAEPVRAEADWENFWGKGRPLRGLRVHAQSNKVEGLLAIPSDAAALTLTGGDLIPWPWSKSAHTLDSVVDYSLRTFKTGDPITKDWNQRRLNIEMNPVNGRIVRAFVG